GFTCARLLPCKICWGGSNLRRAELARLGNHRGRGRSSGASSALRATVSGSVVGAPAVAWPLRRRAELARLGEHKVNGGSSGASSALRHACPTHRILPDPRRGRDKPDQDARAFTGSCENNPPVALRISSSSRNFF